MKNIKSKSKHVLFVYKQIANLHYDTIIDLIFIITLIKQLKINLC